MSLNLVIVESPAKEKTIKKFLGSNYVVKASVGHVRDLPKSRIGVDVEGDFTPDYITIRGKGEILKELRKYVKNADKVYLATDPDREGEAIAWHLYHSLKLSEKETYRITFNEITKEAVKNSIKNKREINMDLVNAQQGRRILDRVVGYSISPILWQKVKKGLSAGRVQSVALKAISDRENEIKNFISEEYWEVEGEAYKEKKTNKMKFSLSSKHKLKNKDEANKVLEEINKNPLIVKNIKEGQKKKTAPLPYTTSSLQQDSANKLNFSTIKTMRIAQKLYEGIDIKGEGRVALITYLRTDSIRISEGAKKDREKYIIENFSATDLGVIKENKSKNSQDAHEAIRPTSVFRTPFSIKDSLSREEFRLYELIWKRFIASGMKDATYNTYSSELSCSKYTFKSSSSKIKDYGFMKIYSEKEDLKEESFIKDIKIGDKLDVNKVEGIQLFTAPPSHFTESTLVRFLETEGIGRPSTYAPTISTLLARRYIVKEGKSIYITEIGEAVNEMVSNSFPEIVDINFTRIMEDDLDKVEMEKIEWKDILREYYPILKKEIEKAQECLKKVVIEEEVSEEICEKCGRHMVVKYGSYGKFLACPGFPSCSNTKPYLEKIGVKCPKCNGETVILRSKKGRKYYGCSNYPECDFISWDKPVEKKCDKCGSSMVEKGNKIICTNKECGYKIEKKVKDE